MRDEILKYLSKFTPITKEIELIISENIVFKTFKKGSVLLNEGDISDECYFILKGCIRSYFIREDEEVTMEFFTEKQSVVPANYGTLEPSMCYLECSTGTIVCVGNPKLEKETFKKYPQLESLTRVIAESLIVKQQNSHFQFKLSTPEERYLNLQKNRPDIIQIAPQHQIASYLGVKPESLSRIRKRILDKK